MGKVLDVSEQVITTSSGQKLIRRIKTVQMPNGRCRYPVDYFDASSEPVLITTDELERKRVPVYERVL